MLLIYIPCVQVVSTNRAEEGSEEETEMKGNEQAAATDVSQPDQKVRQVNPILVDHPTQLICIWIFICQQTNTTDIAGQSARVGWGGIWQQIPNNFVFFLAHLVLCITLMKLPFGNDQVNSMQMLKNSITT